MNLYTKKKNWLTNHFMYSQNLDFKTASEAANELKGFIYYLLYEEKMTDKEIKEEFENYPEKSDDLNKKQVSLLIEEVKTTHIEDLP